MIPGSKFPSEGVRTLFEATLPHRGPYKRRTFP